MKSKYIIRPLLCQF